MLTPSQALILAKILPIPILQVRRSYITCPVSHLEDGRAQTQAQLTRSPPAPSPPSAAFALCWSSCLLLSGAQMWPDWPGLHPLTWAFPWSERA